jgi:hypothetical protein
MATPQCNISMKSRESAERLVIFGTVMLVSAWALSALASAAWS